jgi:hypothetical protein
MPKGVRADRLLDLRQVGCLVNGFIKGNEPRHNLPRNRLGAEMALT